MFLELEGAAVEYTIEKQLTISDFRAILTNLSKKHTGVHKGFFEKMFSEILGEADIHDSWQRLRTNWSFTSCTIFEDLVCEFGNEALKEKLEDYLDKLTEFQCTTQLSECIEDLIKMGVALPDDFIELVVTLNQCHGDYKLDDFEKILETVAETFFLPKFVLILKNIEITSFTITWAIPAMITASLKEIVEKTDMDTFCRAHRITSIDFSDYAVSHAERDRTADRTTDRIPDPPVEPAAERTITTTCESGFCRRKSNDQDPHLDTCKLDVLALQKKTYQEMERILRNLCSISETPTKGSEKKIFTLLKNLRLLLTSRTIAGKVSNPLKLLQLHLKHVLFNSGVIKDDNSIKTFLKGIEDNSAAKSDRDDSIFVFSAKFAAETVWYKWDDSLNLWQWTPEADGSIWMPCSTTKISDGKRKGETAAAENAEIISYLNAVRPFPNSEEYLPTSCDVVALLDRLSDLGDDGVAQLVKGIGMALLVSDVDAGDVDAMKNTVQKLELLMEKLSHVEEYLEDEIRVKENLIKIKESFASLKNKVIDSLESKEDLDLELLHLFVRNIFSCDDLAKALSVTDVFETLSENKLWDYYNYTALVNIAEVFGGDNPELMECVNSYRLEMGRFIAKTKIEHYIEAREEDRSQEEEGVLQYRDIFKVDLKIEAKEKFLVYFDTVETSIFGYFECPRQSVLLHSMEIELYPVWDYVVEVIWLVTPEIAEVINKQFEENDVLLAEIEQLEGVKDMLLQFCRGSLPARALSDSSDSS